MLLKLVLPPLGERDGVKAEWVRIDTVDAAPGAVLGAGARLIEFTMGLDAATLHDCPPVTTYRMTLSETAWIREISIAPGSNVPSQEVLGLLSTTPDEPIGGEPERAARVVIAAILRPMVW